MRKVLLFAISALYLSSCSKSGNENNETVNPQDAAAVSKAITVWHASRVTGTPPAPSNNGNGPQLDQFSNNQSVIAIQGRYAVLQPSVTTGSVKGYYVQVAGASEYFKVDYSKPRTGGRGGSLVRKLPKHSMFGRIFGTDSTGNGTLDSALVINIPTNIQPGQFCISYCAYDSLGNVSNVITSCITVAAFGGDASVSYLNGLWKHTAYRDTSGTWYPANTVDTTKQMFTCVNGQLQSWCPTTNCVFTEYITDISGNTKSDFTFGSNGGLKIESDFIFKSLDLFQTTCTGNPVYSDMSSSDVMNGAWSYNSTTQKLTMILDFNVYGIPEPQAMEFSMQKISNTRIHLTDPNFGGEVYRLDKN